MNYRQISRLPNEFRLAVACCRWAYARSDGSQVTEFAATVHWDQFLTVVRRHRIEGLAWHSLSSLDLSPPPHIAEPLAASARSIADQGLRAAAESARLQGALLQIGIAPLFLKGLTLGKLAYGNPFLKMSMDLDLLVALADIPEACRTLKSLGYRLCIPSTERDLPRWHARRKESVWYDSASGLVLELHGRLADNPRVIPNLGMGSRQQLVEIAPAIVLPTLAREELFAYLCVHGSGSGWHRLKWISDLAALLHGATEAEIAHLYRSSQSLGAGRSAGQALMLAHGLFDIPLGAALERALTRDRTIRCLVWIAMHYLVVGEDQDDPTDRRGGTVLMHLSQLLLVPSLAGRMREIGRKLSHLLHPASGEGPP